MTRGENAIVNKRHFQPVELKWKKKYIYQLNSYEQAINQSIIYFSIRCVKFPFGRVNRKRFIGRYGCFRSLYTSRRLFRRNT